MKRAKRIYALLGVLAVICVITFLVVRHEEEQENIRNSGEVVLEVVRTLLSPYHGRLKRNHCHSIKKTAGFTMMMKLFLLMKKR